MDTIVFTGGGTGGHVYPGLAVLSALPEKDRQRVVWIGSRHGVERGIVSDAGVPFWGIPAGKLRRYFDWQNLWDVIRVFAGVHAAWRLLGRLGVSVVFSKGGYVAVPVVVAAWLRGIPVLIHESDADPGLATRLTGPLAKRIFLPYHETLPRFPQRLQRRASVIGNPVRRGFFSADPAGVLEALGIDDPGLPVVVVTGGSLGALQINTLVHDTISSLTRRAVVIHQVGDHSKEMIPEITRRAVTGRYHGAPSFGSVFPALLRRADLVVARAGAGTIWEIAVTGRPSVLIPLSSGASRGDQMRNARRYCRDGTPAVVLDDPELSAERFLAVICALLDSPQRRQAMSDAASCWGRSDGAERLAREILVHSGSILPAAVEIPSRRNT